MSQDTPEPTAPDAAPAGAGAATPQALFDRLARLGLRVSTITHPPVFTVEEAKTVRGPLPGAHTKNLFVRNKKGRMWLVCCLEDREVDLKALGTALGAGRLSFASAERLNQYLGVVPGAVTPFAAINDTEGAVTLALDRQMLDSYETLHAHPLDNAMTTAIAPRDLVVFLEAVGHPPLYLDDDAFG